MYIDYKKVKILITNEDLNIGDLGEVDFDTILRPDGKYPVWIYKLRTEKHWYPEFLYPEQFEVIK